MILSNKSYFFNLSKTCTNEINGNFKKHQKGNNLSYVLAIVFAKIFIVHFVLNFNNKLTKAWSLVCQISFYLLQKNIISYTRKIFMIQSKT